MFEASARSRRRWPFCTPRTVAADPREQPGCIVRHRTHEPVALGPDLAPVSASQAELPEAPGHEAPSTFLRSSITITHRASSSGAMKTLQMRSDQRPKIGHERCIKSGTNK